MMIFCCYLLPVVPGSWQLLVASDESYENIFGMGCSLNNLDKVNEFRGTLINRHEITGGSSLTLHFH